MFSGFGPAAREPVALFSSKSGLIAVPAGVGLVNSAPYLADGTLSQGYLLDRRLHVSLGETEGPRGADPAAASNPFAALGEQRFGNLSGDLWRNGNDALSFTSTVIDSSRPVIDESSGLPTGEERNRVFGSGLSFSAADNRLRGVAELAWSRSATRELRADHTVEQGERADLAWRARLDADLLKGDSHALSAWVHKRRVAPGYVAVNADAPPNRDELAMGAHGRLGMASLDFSFVEFTDNLDREKDMLTTRDRAASVTLGFDLHEYRPGPLAPIALRLTASHGSLTGLPELSNGTFPDPVTNQRKSAFGIAADWPVAAWGGNDMLTLGAMRFEMDNRQPGMETADVREDSVTLAYTANRPLWTGSLSATVTDIGNAEEGNRSQAMRYSVAAYAATTPRAGYRLSLSANISHTRTGPLDPSVNGDIDTTWQITAGGELNGLFGAERFADTLPIVGYLRIAGNDPDEADTGLRSVEVTAGAKARLIF